LAVVTRSVVQGLLAAICCFAGCRMMGAVPGLNEAGGARDVSREPTSTPVNGGTENVRSSHEFAPAENAPRSAILSDEARVLRHAAQLAVLGEDGQGVEDPRPRPLGLLPGGAQNPEQARGFFTPMQTLIGADPLANFEMALRELEKGEREEPLRIAVYGASAVVADLWTGYLRHYLQGRFGNGGPGMVAAAKPTSWYRHQELRIESSKHWTRNNAYHRDEADGISDPGNFGAMGQSLRSDSKRAWTKISPARRAQAPEQIAFYEVHHLLQPDGGRYRIRVDGKEVGLVSTATEGGDPSGLGRFRVAVEIGSTHELRIEVVGDGMVRLLGVVAETAAEDHRAGIVVDTLGLNGAMTSNQARWNEMLWLEHLKTRAPELIVFAYGNNESAEEELSMETFERDFRAMLDRFRRAASAASCVVVAPGDFPRVERDSGELSARPRQAEIRAVERELSDEYGCAFFDTLALMGGDGAKKIWFEAGLAQADHLHLTRRGYVLLGMVFADALLYGYDDEISRR